jgi:hypothetical protein
MTVQGTANCTFGVSCTPLDAEMTPRFKLTAVPYAFRAGALMNAGGTTAFTADDLIQKAPSSVQAINLALAAIRLNQTGAGGLLQLQGAGNDVFTVANTGDTVTAGNATIGGGTATVGTTTQSGSLVLSDGSGNTTTLQAASTAGNLTFTLPGATGANGDCLTTNGAGVLSFSSVCGGTLSVNPTANVRKSADETQNNVVNPTATLQNDDQLFFGIGANETWSFRFVVQATNNATPDIKFAVTAPTGATCVVGLSEAENALSNANVGCGVSLGAVPATTSSDIFEVVGTVVNGATAGNVQLQWAQNTANAANTIVRTGSYLNADRISGPGQTAQAFIQSGNSFGALAVLGTNDNNALSVTTNGVERIRVLATGETRFADDVIANGTATGTTGTTSGTGTNTTSLILLTDAFNVNDTVFIDNAGQDYYTRIVTDAGTGTYTVSPAVTFENARTVTRYTLQNIGATTTDYTTQANRFFQGYFLGGITVGAGSTTLSDGLLSRTTGDIVVTPGTGGVLQVNGTINATTITGDGSSITNINGANISGGSIADGSLSANVALLNTAQSFTALQTLNGGLTVSGATLINTSGTNTTGIGNATGAITLTGSGTTTFVINGATVDATEFTRLDGIDAALLDANDAVATAITGTGALTAGSITTGFGNIDIGTNIFTGNGSGLTSLNASNISSGTLADGRLSANVTLLGNTFNGASQLVQLNGSGELPVLSGVNLTSLNATNLTSGTVADTRLSTNVTLLGNTFNGNNQLVQLNGTGQLPALSGVNLTSLNASNISSGTLANAQLTGSGALTITAGTGLTGGGSVALGSSITIDVAYGSTAGTAVQGNTSLTCASGTGNLTGGGNAITLGSGGTCSALDTNNAVSFTTSVTTPVLTSSAALALSSGGTSNLSFNSASNILIIDSTDTTLQRTAAGNFTIDLADAGATSLVLTNSAAGAASLNLSDGGLLTGGTARLTNGGALQNINGLTIASGGASVTGASTFADATNLNGNVVLGDAATDRLTITSEILGTNALSFQGAVDNGFTTTVAIAEPTANNVITLPNMSGTFALIGTAIAQVDAGTNTTFFVNKTGATGNILTLQDNGVGVFTIANDGATLIQLNSTAAFNIKNTTGTDQFIVDSTNSLVRVGSATADATATVLISDAKNTTGDPAGAAATNGAQYYNSFWQQYRCYRDGKWETCGVNPIERAFVFNDEFISGYTGAGCTTATAIIGDQNWTCFTSGTANTAYNTGAILPTADRPGIIRMTTAAANGNGFTMALAGNNSGSVVIAPQNRVKAAAGQGATITNNRLRIGLHAETTTNVRPTTGVWWEADATTNANWNYCYGTGAVATCASSGVAITASTMYSLDILVTATGAGTSAATFTINGTAFNVSGVTISTAARVNPAISCFNSVAAVRECYVDYFQFSGVAAARR